MYVGERGEGEGTKGRKEKRGQEKVRRPLGEKSECSSK